MHSSPNLRGLDSGFKIPRKNSWIQEGRIQDSRLRKTFWIPGFKIQDPGIQEVFSEPWILNLESSPLDSRILSGNLESWILGFKKFFLRLQSWILNPTPLDLGKNAFWMHSLHNPRSKILTRLAKNCNYWSPENALNCRIQNIKENTVNNTKFAWNVGLGGEHIYIYYTILFDISAQVYSIYHICSYIYIHTYIHTCIHGNGEFEDKSTMFSVLGPFLFISFNFHPLYLLQHGCNPILEQCQKQLGFSQLPTIERQSSMAMRNLHRQETYLGYIMQCLLPCGSDDCEWSHPSSFCLEQSDH